MQVGCEVHTPAIASFSALEDSPEAFSDWAPRHSELLRQALSVNDRYRTIVYPTGPAFLNIMTDFGLPVKPFDEAQTTFPRPAPAVLTTLHLNQTSNLVLGGFNVDFQHSRTGIWMGGGILKAAREGRFYQLEILPPGQGLRVRDHPRHLGEPPVITHLSPLGVISRLAEDGIKYVVSPWKLMHSTNGHK